MRDRGTRLRDPRMAIVAAASLVAGLLLTGCGVSSQPDPVRVGDGLAAGGGAGGKAQLPPPSMASDPEGLVRLFFKASAGGGSDAVANVRDFLTARALQEWQPDETSQLTVVRLLNVSASASTGSRTSVTVDYQMVGTLTEQGNIDELADVAPARMTFDVLRPEETPSQLRIDKVTSPPGVLLLSDDALDDVYYQAHPIYFWDTTGQWLVPDLRYLPLTIDPEQRPDRILQWLLEGPSPWLRSVQALPAGTTSNAGVVNRQEKLLVNLSAQAGAGGDDSLHKLVYQLRWSLRTTVFPEIELQIEGQTRNVGSTADVTQFVASAGLGGAQRFAIENGKVVARPASGASPSPEPVLAAKENRDVVAAAVSRKLDIAAFVRADANGTRSLYVARKVGDKIGERRVSNLPRTSSMSRPVIVPGAEGEGKAKLLVVANGGLYAVSANDDRASPVPISRIGQVEAIAVPPDARRIAFVADGRAYVAALNPMAAQMSVGSQLRPILPNQVRSVAAVAWTSENVLLVAGANNNRPSLWQVTADGVAADDRSPDLKGLMPTDVVAHPESPTSPSLREVTVQTTKGAGQLFSSVTIEEGLRLPFYAG